ncbi:hypothetical protein BCM02_105138 [Paenibacillus methanolicus]|uniref:Uncharacterized protein n=1 Tax=Paenibacillus methanolicus TaxID=582686 RepID=A0A5S5C5I7_9BACL|nr:hypothetical protein BCM02_105138 [Paenibacillus methanolicus]
MTMGMAWILMSAREGAESWSGVLLTFGTDITRK